MSLLSPSWMTNQSRLYLKPGGLCATLKMARYIIEPPLNGHQFVPNEVHHQSLTKDELGSCVDHN